MAEEWTTQRQDEAQEGNAQRPIPGEMPQPAQGDAYQDAYAMNPQQIIGDMAQGQMEALDNAAQRQVETYGDAAQQQMGILDDAAQRQMQTLDNAAQYQVEALDRGAQYQMETSLQPMLDALPDPLLVRAITVRTGRLVIDVEVPDARYRYTTPRLSAFVNGQFPDLPQHACVNDLGNTFGYVMERTSTPHLLEHLIISRQVRNQQTSTALFVGTTEWTDEAAGLARIEVGFKDDLVALRAFNEATQFLNMAMLTCLA